MRRMHRKLTRKIKAHQKKHISVLEALRLYSGVPVEV